MPEDTTATSTEPAATSGDPAAPGATTPAPTTNTPTLPGTTEPEKKYTDADVDRLQAKRAATAEKAALAKVADDLGMSVADAKKLIAAQREAEDAKKDALTRAEEQLAAAQRDAETARSETARLAHTAKVERKLRAAGADDGTAFRGVRLVEAGPDATDEDLDAEIAQLVADVPGLFPNDPSRQPAETSKPRAPSGVTPGAAPPPGGQGTTTSIERGRERARAAKATSPSEPVDPFAGMRTA